MWKIRPNKFLKACKDSAGIRSIIAKKLDCNPCNLTQWLKRNPEFLKYIEEEQLKVVDKSEAVIIQDINNNNVETAKWFLTKSKMGRERGYGEKIEHENSFKGDNIKLIIERYNGNSSTTKPEAGNSV